MTHEPNRLKTIPRDHGPLAFITDIEALPLIDPTHAADFLDVARHTLACYRNLGDGPAYYKLGRWIRYTPDDLAYWRDGSAAVRPIGRPTSDEVQLATPALAAHFLTVTPHCLRSYRVEGIGPRYLRYGKRIYYPVRELETWVESRRCDTGANVRRPTQTSKKRHR